MASSGPLLNNSAILIFLYTQLDFLLMLLFIYLKASVKFHWRRMLEPMKQWCSRPMNQKKYVLAYNHNHCRFWNGMICVHMYQKLKKKNPQTKIAWVSILIGLITHNGFFNSRKWWDDQWRIGFVFLSASGTRSVELVLLYLWSYSLKFFHIMQFETNNICKKW